MYAALFWLCLVGSPQCTPALQTTLEICTAYTDRDQCVTERVHHAGVTILRGQGDPASHVTILRGPGR